MITSFSAMGRHVTLSQTTVTQRVAKRQGVGGRKSLEDCPDNRLPSLFHTVSKFLKFMEIVRKKKAKPTKEDKATANFIRIISMG